MYRVLSSALICLPLLACVDSGDKCSENERRVYDVTVFDDDTSAGVVAYLEVETTDTGSDLTKIIEPWQGNEIRLPYRLPPVISYQEAGSIIITAYDRNMTAVASISSPLGTASPPSCEFQPTSDGALQLELD